MMRTSPARPWAISVGRSAGDTLAFTDQSGITGSYDALSGVLSLSGTSSVGNYQAALRSVKFANAGPAPTGGARTITFTVRDPSNDSGSDAKTVSLALIDDRAEHRDERRIHELHGERSGRGHRCGAQPV